MEWDMINNSTDINKYLKHRYKMLKYETVSIKAILLLTVPECINKDFIVLDCNWANSTAKFKCTLKI